MDLVKQARWASQLILLKSFIEASIPKPQYMIQHSCLSSICSLFYKCIVFNKRKGIAGQGQVMEKTRVGRAHTWELRMVLSKARSYVSDDCIDPINLSISRNLFLWKFGLCSQKVVNFSQVLIQQIYRDVCLHSQQIFINININ